MAGLTVLSGIGDNLTDAFKAIGAGASTYLEPVISSEIQKTVVPQTQAAAKSGVMQFLKDNAVTLTVVGIAIFGGVGYFIYKSFKKK